MLPDIETVLQWAGWLETAAKGYGLLAWAMFFSHAAWAARGWIAAGAAAGWVAAKWAGWAAVWPVAEPCRRIMADHAAVKAALAACVPGAREARDREPGRDRWWRTLETAAASVCVPEDAEGVACVTIGGMDATLAFTPREMRRIVKAARAEVARREKAQRQATRGEWAGLLAEKAPAPVLAANGCECANGGPCACGPACNCEPCPGCAECGPPKPKQARMAGK
jgi:hypothetical protein